VVVLVGICIFAGFVGRAHAAQQSTDVESTLAADINQERISRGLGALSVSPDLVAWGEHHSADMAAAGRPYHDKNIQSQVQGWQELGDNVGSGPDADHLHQGFMNSQIHRDEILHPSYTQVGVGAFWAGNVLYVTEVFRLPEQAPVRVVRAVAPTHPTPAPRVVVRSAAVPSPVVTTPPTTAAPPPTSSTSTSMVAAAAPQWPSAALKTRRAASHSGDNTSVPTVAVVAALLLMLVAGAELHTLRLRATRF
jgi:hypothetical protein